MFQRFRANLAALGPVNGTLYSLDRALAAVSPRLRLYRYVIVAQPVRAAPLLPPGRGKSIAVRPLEPGDPAFAQLPIGPDVLAWRFGQGATCLGAFRDGVAIGCLWLAFDGFEEDEIAARFVPDPAAAAWDFDVWVDPAHRTGLAFARLWDEANALMRARGIRWSVSRISAFNAGSQTAHARLDARPLGTVTALRLGGLQLAWSGTRPRLSLAAGRRGRPVYRIPGPEVDGPTG
ncbi:MAG: hypothetical protein AB7F67_23345 [Rhodospirillaceae bacterium]